VTAGVAVVVGTVEVGVNVEDGMAVELAVTEGLAEDDEAVSELLELLELKRDSWARRRSRAWAYPPLPPVGTFTPP